MSDEGTPARRGPSGPRGRGRRSLADRERIQREEDERNRRAARGQSSQQQRKNARGRGRGNYGEPSGPKADPDFEMIDPGSAVPLGPFSLGSIIDSSKRRSYSKNWAPTRRDRASDSLGLFTKVKKEQDDSTAIKKHEISRDSDSGDESGDCENDGIQTIDVNDLTLEEQNQNTVEGGELDFFPVSIERKPHIDRKLPVNAQTSGTITTAKKEEDSSLIWMSKKKRGKQREVDGAEDKRWKGVYQDNEDEDSVDMMEITRRQAGMEDSEDSQGDDDDDDTTSKLRLEPLRSNSSKGKKRQQQKGPLKFETEEDQKEWERMQYKHEHISQLLGGYLEHAQPGEAEALATVRELMPFLVQFPPGLPALAQTGSKAHREVAEAERDDEQEEKTAKKDVAKERIGQIQEPGYVGKLRVYKSGKANLDWGGISLDLKKGMSLGYYQDAVFVPSKQSDSAKAVSLSIVHEKLILTPEFDMKHR